MNMYQWVDECMNGRLDGQIYGSMDRYCIDGWVLNG